ncbi:ImmA/IrrE family metallo-endopeptidase [Emticicia sp. 21SJ11W-3]|uniref:ImmA/IrrE family metallo-endopeptidase n=1 Tax=Emticicia sp. 21SJ11W-3 TaxID=2916755 RepID=UPI00209DFA5E|nr:ImmA/IrrE family metallo-endopeptidase [Emticicia sp. 21SJ11W-3]UTA66575.1 ImmA/IrrE family metallo-endopeptidase [Emticicia sp. 21SJ11W-3]
MKRLVSNKIILEKEAVSFRTKLGYGQTEPIQLKALLLKLQVLTLFRPMSENFSGMAIKIEQEGETHRFIMINSDKSLGHQNFTICHELYHLYIQTNFQSRICEVGSFNKKDREEYNADVFASYFLLPEDAIRANIPDEEIIRESISIGTILRIEQMFNCSRSALLVRLKELGFLVGIQAEKFEKSIKSTAVAYGYSPYLYEKSAAESVVGNYGELAHNLYEQGKISENHYYSIMTALGLPIESVEFQDDEINH